MTTLEGTATVVESPTPPHRHSAYFAKYQGQIERLGWTPNQFSDDYSALIRITVNRFGPGRATHRRTVESQVSTRRTAALSLTKRAPGVSRVRGHMQKMGNGEVAGG